MMSMDICHDSIYDENKFLFHNSKYEDSLIFLTLLFQNEKLFPPYG